MRLTPGSTIATVPEPRQAVLRCPRSHSSWESPSNMSRTKSDVSWWLLSDLNGPRIVADQCTIGGSGSMSSGLFGRSKCAGIKIGVGRPKIVITTDISLSRRPSTVPVKPSNVPPVIVTASPGLKSIGIAAV